MPALLLPPAPPAGPGLAALIAGLAAPAALRYESSLDLCTGVAAACGQAVVPAVGLDTTDPTTPPLPATGHRATVPLTNYGLLHAMGENIRSHSVLPPPLSAYAGQWAIVSYLWSLRPPVGPPPAPDILLSPYAKEVKGRYRGTWTENVAIGVASVLLQRSLLPGEGASGLLDVDAGWLDWAKNAGYLTHPTGPANQRPDYLAARWDATGAVELVAIECKGSTKARIAGLGVVAAGVPQVMSVAAGTVPLRRWVVGAACPRNNAGTWHPQVVEIAGAAAAAGGPLATETVDQIDRAAAAALLEAVGEPALAARVMGRPRTPGPDEVRESRKDDRGRNFTGRTLRVTTELGTLEVFLGLDDLVREPLERDAIDEVRGVRRARSAEIRSERSSTTGYAPVRTTSGAAASLSSQGTLLEVKLTTRA